MIPDKFEIVVDVSKVKSCFYSVLRRIRKHSQILKTNASPTKSRTKKAVDKKKKHSMHRLSDNNIYYWILVFSTLIFIFEILSFYLVEYVHDYLNAVMIISYALLGMGLASVVSSEIGFSEDLSIKCLGGTLLSLVIALVKILGYPGIDFSNLVLALPFFFPSLFIAVSFREANVKKTYLYDMAGAFLGIMSVFAFFKYLSVELICLSLVFILSIIGTYRCLVKRKSVGILFFLIYSLATIAIIIQISTDSLNLVYTINCIDELDQDKIFCRLQPGGSRHSSKILSKSYDGLVGRVDVTERREYSSGKKDWHGIYYHGIMNDHFNDGTGYTCCSPSNTDRRVITGIVDMPRILVVGTSAKGITGSVPGWTNKTITGYEINPSVIEIMTKDYHAESGGTYDHLNISLGNAISLMKTTDEKFDIITLINTHSMPSIGYLGRPDYLHTKQSYEMYLDHLTPEGYVMFEERPVTETGMVGIKRMLATFYEALSEKGSLHPQEHFVIYSWNGGRSLPTKGSKPEYVSILVSREPLSHDDKVAIAGWFYRYRKRTVIDYVSRFKEAAELKGIDYSPTKSYEGLFTQLAAGISGDGLSDRYDLSPITNNRPYSSQVDKDYSEVREIITPILLLCILFIILLTCLSLKNGNHGLNLSLAAYSILIGAAYLLIEIVMMQKYQNIFIAPTTSLIAVLGLMLLSSGAGGYLLSRRISMHSATLLLTIIVLMNYVFPELIQSVPIPSFVSYFIYILLISAMGFVMGVYFPVGLSRAKSSGLAKSIPLYFGLAGISGTLGVIISLYMGIIWGYFQTLMLGIILYILAGLLIRK